MAISKITTNSVGAVTNINTGSATPLTLQTNNTTAVTIDASQNVGIGVTPSATGIYYKSLEIGKLGAGVSANTSSLTASSLTWLTNNSYPTYSAGVVWKYATSNLAARYAIEDAAHLWYNAPSGTAGNTVAWNTAMTLDASGNLLVGATGVSNHIIYKSVAQGSTVLQVSGYPSSSNDTAYFYGVSGASGNVAASGFMVAKNSSTNRSINASGTINASGADYAEYMTKASDFILVKGDVVGINANGKLTNVFTDTVSFVVKSTNPSYVGGDTWGTEDVLGLSNPKQPVRTEDDTDETFAEKEAQYIADKAIFDDALEDARQLVDRIAFAGQVPVNVLGATAGQYIIPINDKGTIKGEAVSSPTFEQYQIAVGKVIAIEADGRARIIVKVA